MTLAEADMKIWVARTKRKYVMLELLRGVIRDCRERRILAIKAAQRA